MGPKPLVFQTHIDGIKQAVLDWLKYEDMSPSEKNQYHIELDILGQDHPRQPEPLSEYRLWKRWNTLPRAGGLRDQPHIWLREMNIVFDAVQEYENRKIANLRMLEEFKKGAS